MNSLNATQEAKRAKRLAAYQATLEGQGLTVGEIAPLKGEIALTPKHRKEWVEGSTTLLEIIEANNIRSIVGEEFEELILRRALELASDASGSYVLTEGSKLFKRHADSIKHGGWYGAGLDLGSAIALYSKLGDGAKNLISDASWAAMLQGIDKLPTSDWGCFKPNKPRRSSWRLDRDKKWEKYDGRVVKYEHPEKVPTSAFFLNYPGSPRLWLETLAKVEVKTIVVEGLKKTACLAGLGFVVIGLPGVTQWNKPGTRELINELAIFARKGREFCIVFDQDTNAKAVRNVRCEIFKLSIALKKAGAKVTVASWDSKLGKGLDDVVAAHGPKPIEDAIANAPIFEYWALKLNSGMSYAIGHQVPKGQKYIDGLRGADGAIAPEEIPIPWVRGQKFTALLAPKGTGKSYAFLRRIEQAKASGQRVLIISHRIRLTGALCRKAGIPTFAQSEGTDIGYGLCIHSLHEGSQAQFNPWDWRDALVIIDECEQVLWELGYSKPCREHRVAITRTLRELVRLVLSPDSKGELIVADADLSDVSLNYLRGMIDAADYAAPMPWVVRSEYKEDGYKARSFTSPEYLLNETVERLERGEKLLVTTDAQKEKSRFGTKGLEDFLKKRFPNLRIGRIDAETLKAEGSPMLGALDHIDAIAQQYDVLICSPSVETGVSIDIRDHFDRVVGFFSGTLATNSVRQFLARLRQNVPRDFYAAPIGLNSFGGGELNANEFAKSTAKDASDILTKIYDAARDDIISNQDFCVEGTRAIAQWAVRQNAGNAAYREIVEAGLRDEGHAVTTMEPAPDRKEDYRGLGHELSDQKHARLLAKGKAIAQAETISDSQAVQLEKSAKALSEADVLSMEKARLKRMYPGAEICPDLFILDGDGWHSKIKLHYALTQGREHVTATDKARIDAIINQGAVWAADVKRVTLSMKLALLEFLDIPKLLKLEFIRNDDPLVELIATKARANNAVVKRMLGFGVSDKDSPVVIARKFLGTVGFKLGKAKQIGGRGCQVREYPIEVEDFRELGGFVGGEFDPKAFRYECDRTPIFEMWLKRDEAEKQKRDEKSAKMAEALAGHEHQAVHSENLVNSAGNKSLKNKPALLTEPPTESKNHRPLIDVGEVGAAQLGTVPLTPAALDAMLASRAMAIAR